MNYFVLFLLALLGLLLQSTLFTHFAIAGVTPDIVLVLVVYFSILQGVGKGGILGFSLGLLEDICLGRFIGMNALAKGATGLFVGWMAGRTFSENLLVPIVSLFIGTIFNQFVYMVLGKMMGLDWTLELWLWKALPLAIYNMCLVPFTYSRFFFWNMKDNDAEPEISFLGKLS